MGQLVCVIATLVTRRPRHEEEEGAAQDACHLQHTRYADPSGVCQGNWGQGGCGDPDSDLKASPWGLVV